MGIDRKIRLFFVAYGRLLFICIAIIVIFIFALRGLNNIVKENKEAKQEQSAQNQMTEEEKNIMQEQAKQTAKEKEYIKEFVDYCKTGKIDEAYSMLSETCKKEKYSSIQDFKEKYINKVFNIEINDYEIQKTNETYIVTLTQDALLTGKTDSTVQSTFKIEEDSQGIYIISE